MQDTITTQNLNEFIGFDSTALRVNEDLTIDTDTDVYVPEYGSYGDDFNDMIIEGIDGWTAVDGFSGQHGYSGPIFHPSEFIGGGLAEWILKTPGYYSVVVAMEEDEDEPGEYIDTGWMLLRKDL